MKDSRLTMEKPVHEMSMAELALNSVYIDADKVVRYRDYEQDVDVRQLTINLLDKLADTPNEFTCDEDFDMFMAELLSEPIESIDGLIALTYRNLWAMAELRARLMEYEDTGLTPGDFFDAGKLEHFNEWRKWKAAQKSGRLLELPCKVGDTVFRVWKVAGRKPEITEHYMKDLVMIVMWLDKFGKDVFLSRTEAEIASGENK